MADELEPCDAGGWQVRVDDFDDAADRIRAAVDPDVDTANMLIAHVDGTKLSLVRSSRTLTVHVDDRDRAAAVLDTVRD